MRTLFHGGLAMLAFAANSVLCRVALRQELIDPAAFSTIRIAAGAAMLLLVGARGSGPFLPSRGSFLTSGLLVLYVVPFSFSYVVLTTGTGALILFGCVQITMLLGALRSGERIVPAQWAGLAVALAGLVLLALPTLATPSLPAALLMALAGVAWGLYSWRGRKSADPLAATTANFVGALPLVLIAAAAARGSLHFSAWGVALSAFSGAVTSGLGYVAWYAALRRLTGLQASVIQLGVPVLAALGGVIFLAESVSARLILATLLVLGGIALAVVGKERWMRRVAASAA
ncbi:MAG TPA: DMT family transporter [Candidatus Polarisedimenticolia bacterium]|nr:DMT family transporter [Candidatus Polarisedimenticolia bacterium]